MSVRHSACMLTNEDSRLSVAMDSCKCPPACSDMTGTNGQLAKLIVAKHHGPSHQVATAQIRGRGKRITYS